MYSLYCTLYVAQYTVYPNRWCNRREPSCSCTRLIEFRSFLIAYSILALVQRGWWVVCGARIELLACSRPGCHIVRRIYSLRQHIHRTQCAQYSVRVQPTNGEKGLLGDMLFGTCSQAGGFLNFKMWEKKIFSLYLQIISFQVIIYKRFKILFYVFFGNINTFKG